VVSAQLRARGRRRGRRRTAAGGGAGACARAESVVGGGEERTGGREGGSGRLLCLNRAPAGFWPGPVTAWWRWTPASGLACLPALFAGPVSCASPPVPIFV
jgi:hypothetical protein